MGSTPRKHLSADRRRSPRRDIIRLELNVRREDAALVRNLVKALGDPERAAETRALLRQRFGTKGRLGLKDVLAAAPLEGIDLTRDRDMGRDVEL